jgi:transposase
MRCRNFTPCLKSVIKCWDEWLLTVVNPDLSARYATRFEQYRLPTYQTEKQSLALTIGCDGHQLLSALYEPLSFE